MAVKEVPTKYTTTDGREFNSKDEAERHDALITARDAYEFARHRFAECLARTQRTSDGHLFDFNGIRTYYYVSYNFWGMPALSEVPYMGRFWDFDDRDGFVFNYKDGDRWREYAIRDMYADKREAEKAVLEAQERRLQDYSEQVAEERKRLYGDKE